MLMTNVEDRKKLIMLCERWWGVTPKSVGTEDV